MGGWKLRTGLMWLRKWISGGLFVNMVMKCRNASEAGSFVID